MSEILASILDFGFLQVDWLMFAAVALVVFGFLHLTLKRQKMVLSVFGIELRPWQAHSALFSALLVLAFIVALSRPHFGYQEVKLKNQVQNTLFLIDVSKSMLASDVEPSRLQIAKRKVSDFIALASKNDAFEERIGLVVFAGSSYLFCPLTSDHAVLQLFLNSISPDIMSSQGSSLGAAISAATKVAAEEEKTTLIMLSDGEDNYLDAPLTTTELKLSKLPLYTIGIGTEKGAAIMTRSGLLRGPNGETVVSKLSSDNMRKLSEASGAFYQLAQLGDGDLRRILAARDPRSAGEAQDQNIRVYREVGPMILLLAMIGIVFLFAKEREYLLFSMLLICIYRPAFADHQAYLDYNNGNYKSALAGFEAEVKLNPDNLRALHALAATQYKLNQFAEAEKGFSQILGFNQLTPRQKFFAHYDLGNSRFMQENYKGAIESYEAALKIKPGDEKTVFNLELAKKKLKKDEPPPEEQQPPQKDSEQKRTNKEDNQQQDPDPQGQGRSTPTPQSQPQDGTQAPTPQNSDQDNAGQAPTPTSAPSSNQSPSEPDQQPSPQHGTQEKKEQGSDPDPDSKNVNRDKTGQRKSEPKDEPALKEEEAKLWLDSIEDSSIMFKKETKQNRSNNPQTW